MLLKRKTLIQKLCCACSRPSSMARPARLSPAAWWPCSHLRAAQIHPLGLDSAHRAPIAAVGLNPTVVRHFRGIKTAAGAP